MKTDYIENRVLGAAKYIIDTKATVRKTARIFGVSKSTIHKDMAERLPKINPQISAKVQSVLSYNKQMRAARGGESTRLKYLQ